MKQDELQGRVIVITGGARGIGREIVLEASRRGACVAFCYLTSAHDATETLETARQFADSDRVMAVQADITQEDQVTRLFNAAIEKFGQIDVLINNAGVSRPHLLATLPTAAWDQVIDTNLTGTFLTSRRAITEFLRRGQGGKIITIGSVTQNGAPSNASYAASKGGLVGLTQAIADEYGQLGVWSYLVTAGYVETSLTLDAPKLLQRMVDTSPLKRLATTSEIASAALFLASDRARAIRNGSILDVSGGATDPCVE